MSETEQTEPQGELRPQYVSLRDYVRVLRRQKWLILAITVLFTAAAIAYSLAQEKTYEAAASLAFRDPLADLGLVGTDAAPEEAPQTRAAANADLISRPEVAQRVAKEIDGDQTAGELAAMVTGQVSVQTNLVLVQASASTAESAAEIANAFADAARTVGTKEVKQRLDRASDSVRSQLDEAENQAKGDEDDFRITSRIDALQNQLTRISTLRRIVEPVEVAGPAVVPGAPVSPKPVRNAALGLLAGLIVGIVVAFARDVLDRRFRTVGDVHHDFGLPVLGRVTDTALGKAGLAAGSVLSMREHDFESFRVLRTNLGFLSPDRPLRSVLVTSGMPEEGKTTVSMALASAAALAGHKVLLVECDLRRPSFARRLNLPAEPGLADYLRGDAEPADVVQTIELIDPFSFNGGSADAPATGPEATTEPRALAAITAGARSIDAVELLGTERFRGFLAAVSGAYDLVILDGSPMLAVVDPLRLIPTVDGVLFCVRVKQSTTDEAKASRAALANLPDKPMGIVVTGLKRGGPDAYEYYYGY